MLNNAEILIIVFLILMAFFALWVCMHWAFRNCFCVCRPRNSNNLVWLEDSCEGEYTNLDCCCCYMIRLKNAEELSIVYINAGDHSKHAGGNHNKKHVARTESAKNVDGFSFAIEQEEEDVCSICLDRFDNERNTTTLECSHEFHKACIRKWLMEKEKSTSCPCPLCHRKIISTTIHLGDHHRNQGHMTTISSGPRPVSLHPAGL